MDFKDFVEKTDLCCKTEIERVKFILREDDFSGIREL